MTKQHDAEKTETKNREGRKLTRDKGLVGEEGLDINVTVWLHSSRSASGERARQPWDTDTVVVGGVGDRYPLGPLKK